MKNPLVSCLLLALLLAACAPAPGSTASGVPESKPSVPSASSEGSVSASSEHSNAAAEEIIENCIAFFADTGFEKWLCGDMASVEEYLQQHDGPAYELPFQVLVENQLNLIYEQQGKTPYYTQGDLPCYPLELCQQVTSEMFGVSLYWEDPYWGAPEGMAGMPRGYDFALTEASVLPDSCTLEGDIIAFTALIQKHIPDHGVVDAQYVSYRFRYLPQQTYCVYQFLSSNIQQAEGFRLSSEKTFRAETENAELTLHADGTFSLACPSPDGSMRHGSGIYSGYGSQLLLSVSESDFEVENPMNHVYEIHLKIENPSLLSLQDDSISETQKVIFSEV